jgi:hypothetical protein
MASAFLKDPAYAWGCVVFAAVLGCGAVFATTWIARHDRLFLSGGYLKWLAVASAAAIATPLLTFLLGGLSSNSPYSLADAYLLGGGIVGGWHRVLDCYAIWLGVALGGVVASLLRRPQ